MAEETQDDGGAANDQFIADLRAVDPRLGELDEDLVTEVAIGRAARDTKLRQAFADRKSDRETYKQQLRGVAEAVRARAKQSPGGGRRRSPLSAEDAATLEMNDGQFIAHCRKKGINLGF